MAMDEDPEAISQEDDAYTKQREVIRICCITMLASRRHGH
jgi:hypothetical protein